MPVDPAYMITHACNVIQYLSPSSSASYPVLWQSKMLGKHGYLVTQVVLAAHL